MCCRLARLAEATRVLPCTTTTTTHAHHKQTVHVILTDYDAHVFLQGLAATTDSEIAHVYRMLQSFQTSLPEGVVPSRMCGHCGLFEASTIRDDETNKENEQPEAFKKCSKCMVEYYCNRNCQKAAWKDHKLICNTIGEDISV
jgi:hypothetical protein